MTINFKILFLFFFSCFTISCSNIEVSYIDREEFSHPGFNNIKSRNSEKDYGAISFSSSKENLEKEKLFVIRNNKSHVYTETVFTEKKLFNKDKNRIFLSIGLDASESAPLIGMKVEF